MDIKRTSNSRKAICRRVAAFTLIELLIVIAIIGILIAMLLPAVNSVREAARRSQCSNNLKQLGLAMHNYHTNQHAFPQGTLNLNQNTPGCRETWMQQILPYIEQHDLYDAYVDDMIGGGGGGLGSHAIQDVADWIKESNITTLVCPSDPSTPALIGPVAGAASQVGFQGNYVMCAGTQRMSIVDTTADAPEPPLDGMFFHFSQVKFAHVKDGSSNTVMGSEVIVRGMGPVSGWGGGGHYWGGGKWGGYGFITSEPPNTSVPDEVHTCKSTSWANAPCTTVQTTAQPQNFARSHHPGGVNVVLVDGSVRFISDNIDNVTWRGLGTRAGGETEMLP